MTIKVDFLDGVTEKRVSPLYQWDYGQTMEIESPDFSTIVEVHFGCPQLQEAIVHACSVVNSVATVRIPDRCLEQSGTITAWIYEIEGTTGTTTKVVYIPVVARTRPPRTHEIPEEVSDKYTELITEVNEAVDALTTGEVAVASAVNATSAVRATHADNASSAAYASSAGLAQNASCDENGKNIANTYLSTEDEWHPCVSEFYESIPFGSYQFKVVSPSNSNLYYYTIMTVSESEWSSSHMCFYKQDGESYIRFIQAVPTNGAGSLQLGEISLTSGSYTLSNLNNPTKVFYRKINNF